MACGRVTAAEVKQIFETDLSDDSINAFIKGANSIVTAVLTGVYSADHLAEIERWLAAHFAAHMDPVAESEKIGDVSVRYALAITRSSPGLGLNNTPYGQQVKVFDYNGVLTNLGKQSATMLTALEVPDA